MASDKILPNFPITINDITNTKYILGIDLTGVRDKAVPHKPNRVDTE